MSMNFHSNKWTIALLPCTLLGFFWAWMFATENKRHTRCSSTILQDLVPPHWKGFSIYTQLTLRRVKYCERNHITCVLAKLAHHISYLHNLIYNT